MKKIEPPISISPYKELDEERVSILKPDSPCVGYCSTSFGDDWCVGCGRSAREVIEWITYDDVAKQKIWNRVESEATAIRFRKK